MWKFKFFIIYKSISNSEHKKTLLCKENLKKLIVLL